VDYAQNSTLKRGALGNTKTTTTTTTKITRRRAGTCVEEVYE